ncbi:HAD superfamily hydrolase [Atractiella rhizophila]|nr:HAD superfamily hydrolase [Atractiella rhizophila]
MPAATKKPFLLFDCDNTLVLSEELAFEGCADLINQILDSKSITPPGGPYTGPQLISDFVGQNFRGMLNSMQSLHNFQRSDEEMESYVKQEEDVVIAKLEAKAQPCVGVMEVLEKIQKSGKFAGLAVVSSSAKRRVLASIRKTKQDIYFPEAHVYSAASSLPKPTSKPDPAIYNFACKELGVEPKDAIAIEDSKSGTLSAVRAGIPTLGYVGPYEDNKKEEMRTTLRTAGAGEILDEWDWDAFLDKIQKLERN